MRQDSYGARPSAGKRLAAAMAQRTGIDGDRSNFVIILLVIIRLVFFRIIIGLFVLLFGNLFGLFHISFELVIVGQ